MGKLILSMCSKTEWSMVTVCSKMDPRSVDVGVADAIEDPEEPKEVKPGHPVLSRLKRTSVGASAGVDPNVVEMDMDMDDGLVVSQVVGLPPHKSPAIN